MAHQVGPRAAVGVGVLQAESDQILADRIVGHDLGDQRADAAFRDMVLERHHPVLHRGDVVEHRLIVERLDGVEMHVTDRDAGRLQRGAGAKRLLGGDTGGDD